MKRIKVIARTTDPTIYVVSQNGREYLESERRIPANAFPRVRRSTANGRKKPIVRYLYLDIPLSQEMAFNSKLYPKNDCIRID